MQPSSPICAPHGKTRGPAITAAQLTNAELTAVGGLVRGANPKTRANPGTKAKSSMMLELTVMTDLTVIGLTVVMGLTVTGLTVTGVTVVPSLRTVDLGAVAGLRVAEELPGISAPRLLRARCGALGWVREWSCGSGCRPCWVGISTPGSWLGAGAR
jgi:hypothetical protein